MLLPRVRLAIAVVWIAAAMIGANQVTATAAELCCDASTGGCQDPPSYKAGRVALVVGVDNYEAYPAESGVKPLKNAGNDARAIGKLLSTQGFSVRCVLEASKRRFDVELDYLKAYVNSADANNSFPEEDSRAFIYVAGHGLVLDGVEYLLFREESRKSIDGRFESTRFEIPTIRARFTGLDYFDLTLVVDACRGEVKPAPGSPFSEGKRGLSYDGSSASAGPLGTQFLIAYSTHKGAPALDFVAAAPPIGDPGTGDNGLYASRLLRYLNIEALSQDAIFNFTSQAVTAFRAVQVPGHFKEGNVKALRSWKVPASDTRCGMASEILWLQRAQCKISDTSVCLSRMCKAYSNLAPSAEVASCLDQRSFMLPDEKNLTEFCKGAVIVEKPYDSTKSAFNVYVNTTGFDLSQIEKLAIAGKRDAEGTIERKVKEIVDVGDRAATNLSAVNALRGKLLSSVQTAGGSNLPIALTKSTSGQPLVLKNLPDDRSGTIRQLAENTAVRVDCESIACVGDWLGVRVGSGANTTRGWLDINSVILSEPSSPRITASFEGVRREVDLGTAKEIRNRLETLDKKSPIQVFLTYQATKESGDDPQGYLADARLMYARSLFRSLGISDESIHAAIVPPAEQTNRLTIRIDGKPVPFIGALKE